MKKPRRASGGKYLAVLAALSILTSIASIPTGALAQVHVHAARGAIRESVPNLSNVVVIVMENKGYSQVIGSSDAPYITGLASTYASATNFFGVMHPSTPNYLAMMGGSTFGVTTDCTKCNVDGTNLIDQLEGAGISWKAYLENMPSACYQGGYATGYTKNHDPFMYFNDINSNSTRCQNVVPMTQLATDLSGAGLPRFTFIAPNLCHDMHDCSVKKGDKFLSGLVPQLLPALGANGVLILTWDEGSNNKGCCTYAHGGRIPTIVAGPGALLATSSSVAYDTYSILATIETSWGLPLLGNAACACTAVMSDLI